MEPSEVTVKTMMAGSKHSMVIGVDGSLYTFGFGGMGALGHRNSKNVQKPKFVTDFLGKKIKHIAAG